MFACSPLGEKTVRWTVLRVWSPQSENPIFSAKSKQIRTLGDVCFFILKFSKKFFNMTYVCHE